MSASGSCCGGDDKAAEQTGVDKAKLPAPPISVPLPTPAGRKPAMVRTRTAAAIVASTPGAGTKTVLNQLQSVPAVRQFQAHNNNNVKTTGVAKAAPTTIEGVAHASGVHKAASAIKTASTASSPGSTEQLFGELWKKHNAQTATLKDDLQKKLSESMDSLKLMDLGNLKKSGALSGFEPHVDTSQLGAQDVTNHEFMKTEKLSMPSSAELIAIPHSEFMTKRMADHEAKFTAATAAALAAINQPMAPRTTAAASAKAPHILSATQAASINQNMRTTEMRDKRTRHANAKRDREVPHAEPSSTKGYTPLGTTATATTSAPLGLTSGTLPNGSSSAFGGGMAGLTDMTNQLKTKAAATTPELQQQADLVNGLAGQLQSWNTLANKLGSLQTYMGVFGKHVRLFLGVQDDARHYSVQHYRGPLLTLLDNDTIKWYRKNDVQQSFANAGCTMTWQGSAPAPGENGTRGKRFQLQWHDVILDSHQRAIVVGTAWNSTSQRMNVAVARFSPDGKTMDPSFYADPSSPTVGSVQSGIFQTESRGVQVLLTPDQLRLLLLTTVFDHDSQQLIATIVALRTVDGKQDTAFGTKGTGTVGMSAENYQGCVAVRMAQHPVTGDIVVLLRMESENLPINKLQSLFLKFQPNGQVYPNFTGVFIDGDSNPSNPNVWLANDIAWSIPNAGDRTQDKLVVTGTIVSQLGDETAQPFVRQYWSNGAVDTTFGSTPSAVHQYIVSGSTSASAKVEILDLTNDETFPTGSATGTARWFQSLNDADTKR